MQALASKPFDLFTYVSNESMFWVTVLNHKISSAPMHIDQGSMARHSAHREVPIDIGNYVQFFDDSDHCPRIASLQ